MLPWTDAVCSSYRIAVRYDSTADLQAYAHAVAVLGMRHQLAANRHSMVIAASATAHVVCTL